MSDLGSLSVLTENTLFHMINNFLTARDVRGVSRSLRSIFDSNNAKLSINPVGHEHMPVDVHNVLTFVACRSPRVIELHAKGGDSWSNVIVALLPILPRLKKLNLSLLVSVSKALVSCLPQLTELEELHLSSNNWGQDGDVVAEVALALRELKTLRDLRLSYNCLTSVGVTTLAPALECLTNLERLDLGVNIFGAIGSAALAPALQRLKNLVVLDLRQNCIDAKGASGARKLNKQNTFA